MYVCENNSDRELMQRDEAKLFFLKYSSAQVGQWQLPPSPPHQGQRDQVACSCAWNALSWTNNIFKVSSWTLHFLYNSARQKELKVEEVLPPPDSDFCICHCSYKVFWGTICGVTAVSTGSYRAFTLIFHRSCDRIFPSIQPLYLSQRDNLNGAGVAPIQGHSEDFSEETGRQRPELIEVIQYVKSSIRHLWCRTHVAPTLLLLPLVAWFWHVFSQQNCCFQHV